MPRATTTSEQGQRPRPTFTLTDAAIAAQVSRSTIRRRLRAGSFPNAEQVEGGEWRVGADDLLAAGFTLRGQGGSGGAHSGASDQVQDALPLLIDPAQERISQLETLLRDERAQREKAEALATAYAAHVADLQRLIPALTAGPPAATAPTAAVAPAPAAPRRRLFGRRRETTQ